MTNRKIEKLNLEKKRVLFFQIGLLTALSLCFFAFEWKTYNYSLRSDNVIFDRNDDRVEILPPVTMMKKEVLEMPKKKLKKKESKKLVIVPDPTPILVDSVFEPVEPIDSMLTWVTVDPEPVVETDPVFYAEVMPEYTGGVSALHNYLLRNIKYPAKDREDNTSGMVYVGFVVDEEGQVTNAKILRGVTNDMNNEALRVINAMPDWSPGSQNGRPVKVYMTIPINYKLK